MFGHHIYLQFYFWPWLLCNMSWYFQPCQPEHQFFSELDLTTGNGTKITLQFYATQTTCAIFWGNIWILRFFSHDMQNDCCKQKKAQEKEQMISFLYEIQFLSKDLHLVFSSLLYWQIWLKQKLVRSVKKFGHEVKLRWNGAVSWLQAWKAIRPTDLLALFYMALIKTLYKQSKSGNE